MDTADDDTLARSQLALLYKLGVLQQDPGEVENDPHAFLNRLPPAAAAAAATGTPAAAAFQSSGEGGWSDAPTHSPYAPVTNYEPLFAVRTRLVPSKALPLSATRVPLSPLPVSPPAGQRSRFSFAATSRLETTEPPRIIKQRWFTAWKHHLETKLLIAQADGMGRRRTKQRVLHLWSAAVYRHRILAARGRQLQCWKAKRVVHQWTANSSLQRRITSFLTSSARGVAFLDRNRRTRLFTRWRLFILWRRRQRRAHGQANAYYRHRFLRRLWIEWRVYILQRRHQRVIYRSFFDTVRTHQMQRQRRDEIANELYVTHTNDQLKRRLKRWRHFNNARQQDHVRTWRIRMVLRRGRFFATWYATLCNTRRIETLRLRVGRRINRVHLQAWYTATRASRQSRSSTLWHPEAICKRYLCGWRRWTYDSLRFRTALAVIRAKQQRRALRVFRAWTFDHARIARLRQTADSIARCRILHYVWGNGWLVFHGNRQHDSSRTLQVQRRTQVIVFKVWRLAWCARNEWRQKKLIARKRGLQSALQSVWTAWCRHTSQRRLNKRQLIEAARHHQHRLLITGLVLLAKIVDRKSECVTAARRIRVGQRVALIRRVFHRWRSHSQLTVSLQQRLNQVVSRPAYVCSLWNPLRRSLMRWKSFTRTRKRLQDLSIRRMITRKRLIFQAWKHRSLISSLGRTHLRWVQHGRCRTAFSAWRHHIYQWRWKRDRIDRARVFHLQRLVSKVLRVLYVLVCNRLRRIRRHYDQLQTRHHHRLSRQALRQWHEKLCQRQALYNLTLRRRIAWLRYCWSVWYRDHAMQAKYKRKLRYYRQLYGIYPASSPFRRKWCRWKAQAVLGASVSSLRHRCELRGVRACFSTWKTFLSAKLVLHQWHIASVVAAATYSDLGKRLRLFRQQHRLRHGQRVLWAWSRVTHWRKRQHERLAETRRQILREIPHAEAKRRTCRRSHLRLWFQRWRWRQLASLYNAVGWYKRRLCCKVLQAWWRQVIHNKQERLLQDARYTVEMMSAHRPPRPPPRPVSSHTRRSTDHTAQSKLATDTIRKKRDTKRMVDPDHCAATYLKQSVRPLPHPRKSGSTIRRAMVAGSLKVSSQQRFESGRGSVENLETARTLVRQPRRVASMNVQELPLFDDEKSLCPLEVGSVQSVVTTRFEPPPAPAQSRHESDGNALASLESLAAMDPYSLVKQPSHRPQHTLEPSRSTSTPPRRQAPQPHETVETRVPSIQSRSRIEPTLYTPRQTLRPREALTSTSWGQRAASSVPKKPAVAKQGLAELLKIPTRRQFEPAPSSTFHTALQEMHTEETDSHAEINVDAVVKVVLDYYVLRYHHSAASNRLETWGFCMLRDLGLFTNGYFVAAMERAIKRVVTAAEHDIDQILRALLSEFIQNHPQYSSHTANRSHSAGDATDPQSWLVTSHLLQRLGRATLSIATDPLTSPFWIRHALPQEVITSLPKLIKCIKKYQKPLEQFFVWRPERTANISTRGLMDTATFVSLVKHCHVYPQLFDRRELESAVACAGSRHHSGSGQEMQLNLPQFVEALVRCGLRLKWIDEASDDGTQTELVVVVKFLMLLFAMEGRGSMLTKRSQDLDAVLKFLQRQRDDAHTKSTKLQRFQGLLRAKSAPFTAKAKLANPTSAFRMAMTDSDDQTGICQETVAQQSLYNFCPDHRGHDAGNPLPNKPSYQLETRRRDLHPETLTFTASAQAQPTETGRSDDVGHENGRETVQTRWHDGHNSRGIVSHSISIASSTLNERDAAAEMAPEYRPLGSLEASNPSSSTPDPVVELKETSAMSGSTADRKVVPSSLDIEKLQAPMDRDAFLNDILSSLHDVELLLQQSNVPRPSPSTISPDTTKLDVDLTSEPLSAAYPERYALLRNGRLPADINASDNGECSLQTDDISISDPLLDHLTFADRFSESHDWQSQLSLVELAAHGIHAAFPSAMHVRTNLHTGELDDLTDPNHTASYLRADDEDEHD